MSAETEALADAGPSLDLAALTEVIFGHVGPLTWTSRTEELPQVQLAKAILASDWLTAHTAAAKRECAKAVVEAVEAEGRKYHGVTPFAVKQAMIAAARAAHEGGA